MSPRGRKGGKGGGVNPVIRNWWWLYQNMTGPELALEPLVAALGRPYRVQHPLVVPGAGKGGRAKHYFADFALIDPGDRILIEVDGGSHLRPAQIAADRERDAQLFALGWRTVRLSNETALELASQERKAPGSGSEPLAFRLGLSGSSSP